MNFQEMVKETTLAECNSIRPQSLSTYKSYLKMYENIMQEIPNSPTPYPLNDEKMRGFLYYLLNVRKRSTTLNTVKLYIASFSYWFKENEAIDETKTAKFQKYIKSIVLTKTRNPPNRKYPITPEILEKMTNEANSNQSFVQTMTATTLMYHGFLRIGELLGLKKNHVKFEENGILLTIIISKTDPEGLTDHCYISNTNTSYSAFLWLKKYMDSVEMKDDDRLFPLSELSYIRCLRIILKKIGITDVEHYSAHSCRRGGAAQAAKNGIQDNVIQRHGRWRSTIFMIYTEMERINAGALISEVL